MGDSGRRSRDHGKTDAGLGLWLVGLRHDEERQIHQSCRKSDPESSSPRIRIYVHLLCRYEKLICLKVTVVSSADIRTTLRRALQSSIYAIILDQCHPRRECRRFYRLVRKPSLSTPRTLQVLSLTKISPSSPMVKGLLSMGIAVSTTKAESVTVTELCPPGLVCGMTVQDSLMMVHGTKQQSWKKRGCGKDGPLQNFVAYYPVIDPNAAKNNQAVVRYASCTAANTPRDPSGKIPPCPPIAAQPLHG